MVDTTETAIYKLGIDPGDSQEKVKRLREEMEALGKSGDNTQQGLDRLISKLDQTGKVADSIKLDRVKKQLADMADEGVGSSQKIAIALELANKKYGEQAKVVVESEKAVSGFGKVLQWLGLQHKTAGADAEEHGRRTNAIKDAMHLLRPAAESAGVSISNLGPFAAAARLGMVGLGAAITGSVILTLIEAVDKVRIFKAQFDAITGSAAGGQGAFAGAKASADSANVSINTLAGAYQTLLTAQDKLNKDRGIVFAPGAQTAVKQINDVTQAIALAGKAGLLTEQQIAQAANTVAQSFATSGKLTSAAFTQLPFQLQRSIADAFGPASGSLARFRDSLDQTDLSFDKFSSGMASRLPQIKAENDRTVPTMTQAWESLKTQVERTTEALARGVNIEGGMKGLTEWLRLVNDGSKFDALVQSVSLVGDQIARMFVPGYRSAKDFLTDQQATAKSLEGIWSTTADFIASVWQSIQNLRTSPLPAAPQFPGVMGGYDAASSGANMGSSYSGFSDQLNTTLDALPEFNAAGLDRIIPPGYPNDSFPVRMNVESGERLIVVPRNQTLSDFVGGRNPINLGRLAGGINLDVGPGGSTMAGPNIDAAITQQGNTLLNLGVSYQDLLGKLGVTFDDWRETISGAGNDDIPDVIRKTGIQIITAESMSCAKIVAAVNNNSSQVSGAIGALSSLVSSNAANSAAVSAASNVAGGSAYSPNIGYGGGAVASGGGQRGGSSSTDGWGFSSQGSQADSVATAAAMAAQRAAPYKSGVGGPKTDWGNTGFGTQPQSGTGSVPSAFPRTAPLGSLYGPGGGYDMSGVGNVDTGAGDYGYSGDYGSEFYGGFAAGGRFEVRGDGGVDTTPVRFNATRGEVVTIDTPGRSSSGVRQSGPVTNVYLTQHVVYHVDLKQAGLSPAQIADQTRIATQRAIASA